LAENGMTALGRVTRRNWAYELEMAAFDTCGILIVDDGADDHGGAGARRGAAPLTLVTARSFPLRCHH
jgi:hypothetical protein